MTTFVLRLPPALCSDRPRRVFFAAARRRGGPIPFGPFFGGGRKAARGDIRAAILALLAEAPMHGYQIIRELSERTGGVWRPSPGSVYPTLHQLEDEGLVREEQSEAGRRVYALTEEGRQHAAKQAGASPWEGVAGDVDDELVELRDLVFQVVAASRQVGHAGTPTQISAAQDLLRTTRQGLYRLLADDEPGDSAGSKEAR